MHRCIRTGLLVLLWKCAHAYICTREHTCIDKSLHVCMRHVCMPVHTPQIWCWSWVHVTLFSNFFPSEEGLFLPLLSLSDFTPVSSFLFQLLSLQKLSCFKISNTTKIYMCVSFVRYACKAAPRDCLIANLILVTLLKLCFQLAPPLMHFT